MVTCPKCKADNRPEAAFCARCGTILFAQPTPSKPTEHTIDDQPMEQSFQPEISDTETEEEPITTEQFPEEDIPAGLQPHSEGYTFADRFKYDNLISQAEHDIHYTVTEIIQGDVPPVRMCSNPECRTIHCPVDHEVENFCTQCGQPLQEGSLSLWLHESDNDQFSHLQNLIDLHLVHPNIHPPIAVFKQDDPSGTRYYLVSPCSADLPSRSDITSALDWGEQLAGALDYLQSKGVVLGEAFDLANIGLADEKAVWRNFNSVRILPLLTDREKINNLRSLVFTIYAMMTGNTSYSMDPYLPPALNELFEKALVGEGFTSGAELIQHIEQVRTSGIDRLILDYQVGRRSHPGMVRKNNEDSMLSMELSSIQDGTLLPCGLFAIADGMGGHASGELASGIVINRIAQKAPCEIIALQSPTYDNYSDWLEETVQVANQSVYEARQRSNNDMGSTLVLCLLIGTQAYLTHLGDSRIYLVNQESIKQLTTDHSLVQHMVDEGKISEDEARFHPQRNVIYRSLGDKPQVEVECLSQQLFPHDRLLLCSDGLTGLLEDQKIHSIILEAGSPQIACDALVEAANSAGGEDNISVILIEVISV